MELVSIIVPVYNVEKYLEECVNSLLRQTYENIQIILIDDGSKDSSGRSCDVYAQKDSRVKVIHKENAGLGYARNSGLEAAKGKYVTFIDADDLAEPDLVELLMKGITETGADTCIGGFKRITEDGVVKFEEKYSEGYFEGKDVYDVVFARMLGSAPDIRDAIHMSVWNGLYSMNIIHKYHINFPSEREFISEDIIWASDYYRYARRVKVIDSTAYNYRIRQGSLTQRYNPDMLDMVCVLYCEMEKRLEGDSSKIFRLQRQFFVNLRVCMKQEHRSISGKNKKEVKKSIQKIVDNITVRSVLSIYPISSIQFGPRCFLLLLKYKLVMFLQACLEMNLI